MDPLYTSRRSNVAFKIDNSARGNAYVIGAPFCFLTSQLADEPLWGPTGPSEVPTGPTGPGPTGPDDGSGDIPTGYMYVNQRAVPQSRMNSNTYFMTTTNDSTLQCIQNNMEAGGAQPPDDSATQIINALLAARGQTQPAQQQARQQPNIPATPAVPPMLAPGTVVTYMDRWLPYTGTVHVATADVSIAPDFRHSQTFLDLGASIMQRNVQLLKDTQYRVIVTVVSAIPDETCTLMFEIATSDHSCADASHESFEGGPEGQPVPVHLFARTFSVPTTGLYDIRFTSLRSPLIMDTPIVHVN